ncbi:hypothetical protein QCA50_011023 [Cerrena zonata]|uniref:Hydrophobin n=1 Tax=Cerrena zonata TaxID=2478898 RepID=A0AAW0G1W6_9APHY
MFTRTVTTVTSALLLASFAMAVPQFLPGAVGSCNVDSVQCCDQVQAPDSESVSGLLGALGISANDLNGFVGVTCTPITGIGAGSGSSCQANPVCCDDNSFGGAVSLGCVPINLSL